MSKKGIQYKREHLFTNPWFYCLQLGFFAGLIWGSLRWLLYYINFTDVLPGFLAEPFMRRSFLVTWQGHITGLVYFMLFSIAAAFLYYFLLGRFRGPYAGLLYGALWWAVLFIGVGPVMGMMQPAPRLGWNSLVTELCVFLVWGLFIGYTIAYEYNDEASREPLLVNPTIEP